MTTHETYMQRSLQLARLGEGNVAPNPMVGAVLVYKDRIIGEGYHQQYGQAHAEVNCINSVLASNYSLIQKSTLYVSLEPCAHYGKTPPCADLIIRNKIPLVVIGCRDSYEEVDGKGIQKLEQAGIEVITGVLEREALELNKRFFTFHTKQRPYIILKWAQSKDHIIANADYSAIKISNDITNRLVHKWRSEEAAILVGTNTALHDNPALTNRLWNGNNPIRLVIDKQLRLPATSHLFDGATKTIVFNFLRDEEKESILFYKLSAEENIIPSLLDALYKLKIQSVLIEGGTQLLQSFINAGCWDEARVITNESLIIENGIEAPKLKGHRLTRTEKINNDSVAYYESTEPQ
ncbi:bifunctional diaminohydroxyphosphoribosylaminopyrimidine deaminase/5-amino-6-(5-phosphoribosylamino)uracil reductase RibD [Ferruginibacter paludis]|nr:bifunctional diaminohydroxyphosphoribosylaminopyrimidine deaminase/5-amino-6-(5-phosphoribosylamino)uracil reductase RibD [Ferruginibacter paludis]MDN3658834.1 bifunctional diaminohydroxyphosphoribosylaminopyrimidine deaminase/5-amino-6-(5-phosphoribosylamino)uracil reductase RibD [Ferruginibacter paludis]